jgi:hypothetical protein
MTTAPRTITQKAINALGQLLILAVARLSRPAYVPSTSGRRPARRFLARHAIDGIVAIAGRIDEVNARGPESRSTTVTPKPTVLTQSRAIH